MKNIISKITNYFKVGTTESMTRLLSFITIISACTSLLIFIIFVCIKLDKGNVDLYGSAAIIGALSTVLTVGFGGKYYGAKLENAKAKEELNDVLNDTKGEDISSN